MVTTVLDKARQAGVFQCGVIKPSDVTYRQDIRDICAGSSCRRYGTTWACPPAVGTVEQCKLRCLRFDSMLVFTGRYRLDDSFDYDGMARGRREFKRLAYAVDTAVRPILMEYLVLSNEGCETCAHCSYPDQPCRFPDRLHHSIEGYGILVSEAAQKAAVNYTNGPLTITFFGAVLF